MRSRTASAAIDEPSSLRWMPSDSRTIVSLAVDLDRVACSVSPGVKIGTVSIDAHLLAPRLRRDLDRRVDHPDTCAALGSRGAVTVSQ